MNHPKKTIPAKKLLSILLILTAAALLIFLVRSCGGTGEDLSTTEGRQAYLSKLGWEIDPASEDIRTVQLPDTMEGILEDYNRMQLEQGYDLRHHLGEQCRQVTYRVTNYPDESQTVLVTLYLQGRRLIAGDIHSTAVNGFMHGLKME